MPVVAAPGPVVAAVGEAVVVGEAIATDDDAADDCSVDDCAVDDCAVDDCAVDDCAVDDEQAARSTEQTARPIDRQLQADPAVVSGPTDVMLAAAAKVAPGEPGVGLCLGPSDDVGMPARPPI